MREQIQAGLVGYGFAARTFHAPVIRTVPGLALRKVVQRSGSSCEQDDPGVQAVKDLTALLADEEIRLVIVTTPSTNHYEIARQALLAGKHVVVEKPFTATTAEADELIELARRQEKVLSVFHNRRWDGDFLTLQEIVAQQKVGRMTEAELRWDRFSPQANPERWRDAGEEGSGTFYDLGVHLIDQALTLFGLPLTVQAELRTEREHTRAFDYFDVSLGYEDNFKVSLKSSLVALEPASRYRLYGAEGAFVKYGEDPQENQLRSGLLPGQPGWGEEPEEQWGILHTRSGGLDLRSRVRTLPGSYASFYQNVYDAITGAAELAVQPEQARMAIRVIELGLLSHREQRRVAFTP
ncbi:oxidoreductase [Paenibacillus sp. JX-17]|uniref:Oxidoreductase n=1 Tax=Paenibacillus lacisoli TaxID=3064525 RepID=A0ABT9CDH9_9BACL|nr:oxidoreductase [Paenibacillus sp. JX-17]MDO7906699.1 oxidoreductase [Paenibacillus sp. JX-17]